MSASAQPDSTMATATASNPTQPPAPVPAASAVTHFPPPSASTAATVLSPGGGDDWDQDDEEGIGAEKMAAEREARYREQESQVLVPLPVPAASAPTDGSKSRITKSDSGSDSDSDSDNDSDDDSDSTNSSSSDDDDAPLIQPRVRSSPSLLPRLPSASSSSAAALRLGPAHGSDDGDGPSMLQDSMSNPPPPPAASLGSVRGSGARSASPASTSASANVITLPKTAMKKEEDTKETVEHDEESIEDDDDNDESDDDEDDVEDQSSFPIKVESLATAAAAPSAIPSASGTAADSTASELKPEPQLKTEEKSGKIVLTLPKRSPKSTTTSPPAALPQSQPQLPPAANVSAVEPTSAAHTVPAVAVAAVVPPSTSTLTATGLSAASAAHSHASAAFAADAASAPTGRLGVPSASIPPTSALTTEGKATLARYRSYFLGRHGKDAWQPLDVPIYNGREIDEAWCRKDGLRRPFLVSSASELGLKLPPAHLCNVESICAAFPPHQPVNVIDVATQTDSSQWSIQQWQQYFTTPPQQRTAVCNVISLEISRTAFAQQYITPPRYVRQLDWMNEWPTEIHLPSPPTDTATSHADAAADADAAPHPNGDRSTTERYRPLSDAEQEVAMASAAAASSAASSTAAAAPASRPYTQSVPSSVPVQLYCLMGTAGSYTDFHVDFGGSSVWYHVVRGCKMFLIAEPSAENFALYMQWMNSGQKQLSTFLPDMFIDKEWNELTPVQRKKRRKPTTTSKVRLLEVHAGQTLFLPGGWIHAVYTPVDSLVFGGNFLHSFDISTHLMVYNMELQSKVESKYQYPNFETLHWIHLRKYCLALREPDVAKRMKQVSMAELQGLAGLVRAAAEWMRQSAVAAQNGYDASRPRRADTHEENYLAAHQASYKFAQESMAAVQESGQEILVWPHNIPFSWNDALLLLREMDLRISQCIYMLEREEQQENDKHYHQRPGKTSEDDDGDGEGLSAEGWLRREQFVQRCYQELQSLPSPPSSFDFIPLIPPTSLPFIRKPTRKRSVRSKEEEEEVEKRPPLPPTASGRIRSHASKYADSFLDAELDDETYIIGEEKAATAADEEMADASNATQVADKSRKRRRWNDSSDDSTGIEYTSDDEEEEDGSDFDEEDASDEEFVTSSKRSAKRSRKAGGGRRSGGSKSRRAAAGMAEDSDVPALPSAPTGTAAPGTFDLAAVRARAIAAAAAASSAKKAELPAALQRVKQQPAATKARNAPAPLSVKERIMQRLKKGR